MTRHPSHAHSPFASIRAGGAALFGCLLCISSGTIINGFCAEPENVDSTLARLSAHAVQSMPEANQAGAHIQMARLSTHDRAQSLVRFDPQDRVLVHIILNGQSSLDNVEKQVNSLKGQVLDKNATYQHGILAAYIPSDQIRNVAQLQGVQALSAEHRPASHVGKYTSQGTSVLQTDVLNKAGLKGDGITVGVISDSFNTAYQNTSSPPATTAAQDVASGDLPVVNVLQDFPDGTDEGRAMCQIVYDEAPHTKIAFATAFVSEVGFANNIVALRTQAGCDVITDDISYLDEPVFSDGLLANAVNTVANSTSLPGKRVIYTSSAGNDGNNGYRNFYRNLTDASVRKAGHHGNLKLNVTDPNSPNYLDPSLTAGGWYNWNPNGGSEPATTVIAPGPTSYQYAIFLQWDDLFDQQHGVTTSYNFLVFDADGNYLPNLSSTTNCFSVQQPLQGIGYLSLGVNYQIAVTKTTQTDPKAGPIPKFHQLAMYTTLDGLSILQGKYFQPSPPNVANIYGHPAASGAIAVAAYDFNWLPNTPNQPQYENFSSPGPCTIYFDQNNHRLAVPQTRLKPEVAGVDGVITTFFGSPYYNLPFAFFGTSAAAPSVAGVGALMLQAAGGSGSLNPATAKSILELTAPPRTSNLEVSQALGASSSGFVSVTAQGQTYFGPNYLTINYFGAPGQSIDSLTVDGSKIKGSKVGLLFNTSGTNAAVGSTSGISPTDIQIVPTATAGDSSFTIKFKHGSFLSGASVGLTLNQDVAGTYPGYTAAEYGAGCQAQDLGVGATFTAALSGRFKDKVKAAFQNGPLSTGFNPADGFGLINAVAAVEALGLSNSKAVKLGQN